MPSVHKSVLVPYASEQMFDLVSAVEAYPQFLPWCGGSQVHERSLHRMVATVGIDYRGIRQSFTTENELHAPHRIGMKLREGPFSRLDGLWHFHTLRHDACKVEFRLDYAFKSGLLGQALVPVFDHIARSFVDAFVRRAEVVFARAAVSAAPAPSAAHAPEAAPVRIAAPVPSSTSGPAGLRGG
jgi:ribosome-associated toxin RatA of RatAB toxin-antitoxin module